MPIQGFFPLTDNIIQMKCKQDSNKTGILKVYISSSIENRLEGHEERVQRLFLKSRRMREKRN